MNNDNWGQEEPFSDMPEEAQTINGQAGASPGTPFQYAPPTRPPGPAIPPPKSPERQQIIERSNAVIEELNNPGPQPGPEEVFEEDDDSAVLYDADLRLEQGSLYKMIMKHDFFAGLEVDPKAANNVQKALRKFAREQMEIMLGMRRESAIVERLEIDFPFNALEVEALRALARAATRGATDGPVDRFSPEVKRVTEEIPSTGYPKRTTLNPIGNPSKTTSPAPIAKPTAKPVSKPLPAKPQAPVVRTKMDNIIDQIAAEEGIPRELLEETGLLNKPVAQLTSQELMDRSKFVASRRGKTVKSSDALPMPSPEQQHMLAAAQVQHADANFNPLMKRVVETVRSMPAKDPFIDPFK